MKKILKYILGSSLTGKIRKVFPSKIQAQATKKQTAETKMRTAFYRSFIGPGDLCFDIGANVGNRISPLLAIGAKVVAVEPQESCYSYIKLKFGKKIQLVTKGVGANKGFKDFYISNGSPMSSFSNEWIDSVKDGRFKEYTWKPPQLTEVTTLDHLIKEFGRPAFIKIDVEGYEVEVLKGLNIPIEMISFEYTVPELTHHAIDCILQIERVNSDIECNYSISESMNFAMKNWLPSNQMKYYILQYKFINTGFGDIYVRPKQVKSN